MSKVVSDGDWAQSPSHAFPGNKRIDAVSAQLVKLESDNQILMTALSDIYTLHKDDLEKPDAYFVAIAALRRVRSSK